jgi:4-amino-4-deoxy-L-arabinose transferase-like glycosyltransferase
MFDRVKNIVETIPVRSLVLFCLALCIPAFLINLGLFAFTGDEAIRSLVALEMKLSGNFIATTMHGADYINKPPLFNWFILVVSEFWGSYGEWPARLTTLLFLSGFAYFHYRMLKPHWGFEMAFFGALMLVTSGRLLFYDAMLGLIDTAFSFTMYALFMSIYFFGSRGKWTQLFVVSYLLMAAGFLFKGFPAIVFQGLSLLAGLLFFKRKDLVISRPHILGGLSGLAVLLLYLFALSQYRDLNVFLSNLMHESTKRTVVAYDWGKFWSHLYKFPFDSIYHFLPWSLTIIFWLDRKFWTFLKEHDFARFNFILLMVNLPVYWTSVQVQPRYLLMFIPLFNTVGIYLLKKHWDQRDRYYRIFYGLLAVLLVVGFLASPAIPFIPAVAYLPHIAWISAGLFVALGLCLFAYFKVPARFMWFFIFALLVIRTGFNLIVLPARNDESIVTRARADVRALAEKHKDKTWWVYGDAYIREPASFYFTQAFDKIIPRTTDTSHTNSIYLVSPHEYPDFKGTLVDTLQTDYPELQLYLYVRE